MSPLFTFNNKLLTSLDNKLATSADCCCGYPCSENCSFNVQFDASGGPICTHQISFSFTLNYNNGVITDTDPNSIGQWGWGQAATGPNNCDGGFFVIYNMPSIICGPYGANGQNGWLITASATGSCFTGNNIPCPGAAAKSWELFVPNASGGCPTPGQFNMNIIRNNLDVGNDVNMSITIA